MTKSDVMSAIKEQLKSKLADNQRAAVLAVVAGPSLEPIRLGFEAREIADAILRLSAARRLEVIQVLGGLVAVDRITLRLCDVFGAEFAKLDASGRERIALDCIGAREEDDCSVEEYRRRIGAGNLASYLEVLQAQDRQP